MRKKRVEVMRASGTRTKIRGMIGVVVSCLLAGVGGQLGGSPVCAQTPARRLAIELVVHANAAIRRRDYAQAIRLCNRAKAADPSYPRAYAYLGLAHGKRHEEKQACAAFLKVLQLVREGPDADAARNGLTQLGCARPASGEPVYDARKHLLHSLRGNTSGVLSVAISRDGEFVASGGDDQTVRLWSLRSGRLKQTFQQHHDKVNSVAFAPDGRLLASGSRDTTVRLWDTRSGANLLTLQSRNGAVSSVAFSPDGRVLAVGNIPGGGAAAVNLWDVRTGRLLKSLKPNGEAVLAIAFSPSGQVLAGASSDQTVRLWGVRTGKLMRLLTRLRAQATAVSFSPDGRTIASSGGNEVQIHSVGTGKLVRTLGIGRRSVPAVTFSPDGRLLAIASHDTTVRLWDTQKGQGRWKLKGHGAVVTAVAFSRDGRLLATGSADKTVNLWRIE